MVSFGSGGAIRGEYFILNRLPYARGLQYEQIFWAMQRVAVLSPSRGTASGLRSVL